MTEAEEIEEKLKGFGYLIPEWCDMWIKDHGDGMGGCWGISSGKQPERGEDYCKQCEFYRA